MCLTVSLHNVREQTSAECPRSPRLLVVTHLYHANTYVCKVPSIITSGHALVLHPLSLSQSRFSYRCYFLTFSRDPLTRTCVTYEPSILQHLGTTSGENSPGSTSTENNHIDFFARFPSNSYQNCQSSFHEILRNLHPSHYSKWLKHQSPTAWVRFHKTSTSQNKPQK